MPLPDLRFPDSQSCPAFTFIERLIVIAILAILALIAVPVFLKAQTCPKVILGLWLLRDALDACRLDHGAYPVHGGNDQSCRLYNPYPWHCVSWRSGRHEHRLWACNP